MYRLKKRFYGGFGKKDLTGERLYDMITYVVMMRA